jgi:transcriptional regulator with XRE-family HTH domain
MKKKLKIAMEAMGAMMAPESVERARIRADREILSIKLAQLREKCGVKQGDMGFFSQTSVSKIENRKDLKVSTLLEYLYGLGMGVVFGKSNQLKLTTRPLPC